MACQPCFCAYWLLYWLSQLTLFIGLSGTGYHNTVIDIIWLEVWTQYKSKVFQETEGWHNTFVTGSLKDMVFWCQHFQEVSACSDCCIKLCLASKIKTCHRPIMVIYNFEVNCNCDVIFENGEVMLSAGFLVRYQITVTLTSNVLKVDTNMLES